MIKRLVAMAGSFVFMLLMTGQVYASHTLQPENYIGSDSIRPIIGLAILFISAGALFIYKIHENRITKHS